MANKRPPSQGSIYKQASSQVDETLNTTRFCFAYVWNQDLGVAVRYMHTAEGAIVQSY
jgi:hypothetical protein